MSYRDEPRLVEDRIALIEEKLRRIHQNVTEIFITNNTQGGTGPCTCCEHFPGQYTHIEAGTQVVHDGHNPWVALVPVTLVAAHILLDTPQTGDDFIIDIRLRRFSEITSASIFPNPSYRPTIADGSSQAFATSIGTVDLQPGDALYFDIIQVGSPGTEGKDLTITVGYVNGCAQNVLPPTVTIPPPDISTCLYDAAVFADSPLIFYKLNELSGTVATDSSGNGYDGTYQGSPTFGVPGPASCDGDVGVLFNEDFPGTNHAYVSIPAFPLNVDAITMECFFHSVGGVLNGANAVDLGTGTNKAWMVPDIASSFTRGWDWGGSGNFTVDASEFAANADWVHWAVIIDRQAGMIYEYADGSLVASSSDGNTANFWLSDTGVLMKRADNVGDTWTMGAMSRFALYDYGLSATQIANHSGAR